jgi:sterol 24-C-methyltransferase
MDFAAVSYRLKMALGSFMAIYKLPQERIDDFLQSYEVFKKDNIDKSDEQKIVDYYSILNHLCALGEVEKMYIPAVIDVSKGLYENQKLFEEKMTHDLNIHMGDAVLDIGCGRGRVAAHIAAITKANVFGLNIDEVQLDSAKKHVQRIGLSEQCQFFKGSLNDRLPFPDAIFNALYQIQVITYAKDKEAVFAEMFRVLKPGGRLSFLDWVLLDNYDASNAQHLDLLNRIKPLIGAINTPSPKEIRKTLEKVGFTILSSQDASIGGHQANLIEKADQFYNRVKKGIDLMVKWRLLPQHFKVLIDRLTQDGEAFIEADRLGLVTTSYQTLAQKPW